MITFGVRDGKMNHRAIGFDVQQKSNAKERRDSFREAGGGPDSWCYRRNRLRALIRAPGAIGSVPVLEDAEEASRVLDNLTAVVASERTLGMPLPKGDGLIDQIAACVGRGIARSIAADAGSLVAFLGKARCS
jgi:hypothetical protein